MNSFMAAIYLINASITYVRKLFTLDPILDACPFSVPLRFITPTQGPNGVPGRH